MLSTKMFLGVLVIPFLIGCAAPLAADEPCVWSQPQPLTAVNTPYFEAAPFESPDGRSLYFHSSRPGSVLNDLYVSHRQD